jgi:hypothetical protein
MSIARFHTKDAEHADLQRIAQEYVASGGKILVALARVSGNGWSWEDWQRAARGLKVVGAADIEAERQRRLLKAVEAKNVELLTRLLQGKFDKQIKTDIQDGRAHGVDTSYPLGKAV